MKWSKSGVPVSGYYALFQQRLPFLMGKLAPPFSLVGIAANLAQHIPGRTALSESPSNGILSASDIHRRASASARL
jgi:hypothetical protein